MAAMSLATLEGRDADLGLQPRQLRRALRPSLPLAADLVSLEITLTVTLVSVVLAYPLAWIIAFRVPARWQRLALLLAILPFWTSYVVRSYAWLLVLAREGVVNQTLIGLGVLAEPRHAGHDPLRHRHRLRAFLRHAADADDLRQPRAAARRTTGAPPMDLGASSFQTFRHVILPLTLPGIMTGAFLTFVLCIGDYITPQILGGNNELTVPQVIMVQLGRRADFPLASALAIVLMGS